MTDSTEKPKNQGLKEFAEDASGFGASDLRLVRDLLLSPAKVIDAYDRLGNTAGDTYPRPLRFYLTLSGLYLLIYAFLGGSQGALEALVGEQLPQMAEDADKSVDAFAADFDQWLSLLSTPVMTGIAIVPILMLVKRWAGVTWRRAATQALTFTNGWTLLMIPTGLIARAVNQELSTWVSVVFFVEGIWIYAMMGRGRWWTTGTGAVLKGVLLFSLTGVAMMIGSLLAFLLSWLAAVYIA